MEYRCAAPVRTTLADQAFYPYQVRGLQRMPGYEKC